MRVVDLFAGAGGFSEGARQAGCSVVWAANHWKNAVQIHLQNHPETIHSCQDLQQTDFATLPDYEILLASPACQGHSRARGPDKPRHDAARSTAWSVVSCVESTRPVLFVVENVVEFTAWSLFPQWKSCLESMGYKIQVNILNAQNFMVPQSRIRVFITGTLKKKPLVLREPSVRNPIAFSSVVDKNAGGWVRVADKAKTTQSQWREGRKVHGEKFLIAYYGNEKSGRSLSKPLGTITTKERFALVHGDKMRLLTVEEYRKGMGFPDHYLLPSSKSSAVKMLGNAVCPPVAKEILVQAQEHLSF